MSAPEKMIPQEKGVTLHPVSSGWNHYTDAAGIHISLLCVLSRSSCATD